MIFAYSFLIVASISIIGYFYTKSDASNVEKKIPTPAKIVTDTTPKVKEHNQKAISESFLKEKIETPAIVHQKQSAVIRQPKDSIADRPKNTASQFTEAAPVEGYAALYSYFDKELKYPGVLKDSIEGIVTVSFAINEKGKPDRIKIENSLGSAFDAECKRVIENMPLWTPATINGKPISVRLSIPLTFKIKK
jgi:TonB family protein